MSYPIVILGSGSWVTHAQHPRTQTHMHKHMWTLTHTHTQPHTATHARTHARTHAHTHAHTHALTNLWSHLLNLVSLVLFVYCCGWVWCWCGSWCETLLYLVVVPGMSLVWTRGREWKDSVHPGANMPFSVLSCKSTRYVWVTVHQTSIVCKHVQPMHWVL